MYLGRDVEKFQLSDGKFAWSMHSASYLRLAVEMVKALFAEDNQEFKSRKRSHKGPLQSRYKP